MKRSMRMERRRMKIGLVLIAGYGLGICGLSAKGITTIEELDEAAVFSFSVISDNCL